MEGRLRFGTSDFCQFLADLSQCEIIVSASSDITTLGTGRFALIGNGLVEHPSDLPPTEKPRAIV